MRGKAGRRGWAPFAALFAAVLALLGGASHTRADTLPLGRLDDAAVPTAYRLDLTVDPSRPRFSGHVEIDVVLARETASLYLHGRGLRVSRLTAHRTGEAVEGRWVQLDPVGLARAEFARALGPGAVTLAFDYDAPFADEPAGLFRVQVDGAWYAWSQFQAVNGGAKVGHSAA